MHRSVTEVCSSLAKLTTLVKGITSAGVYITGEEDAELAAKVGPATFPRKIVTGDCIALITGEPHTRTKDIGCSHRTARQSICIPIIGGAEIRGVLFANGQVNSKQTNQLRVLAGHVGLSLASIQYQARLRAEAYTDHLTGLSNRRHFETTMAQELARSARRRIPTSLLFMDVDHFKRYNDINGHDSGDEVLRQLGQIIQASIRTNETAARWGGEEFAVILPNTEVTNAFARAEALRKSFKHLSSHKTPPLTISIGISAAPHCGMTMRELVRSADAALYRAKATRDRTDLSDPIRQVLVSPDKNPVDSTADEEQSVEMH